MSDDARHLIVGTAGHIDHGKSALVQALTGTDPDRLKDEKLRGITIELGFADLDLGHERVLSFVDVPGHERFVRHMVAGATGIDAVVLVVAADQGVQPQTREHLAICSLLGVSRGVIALTKTDLVDTELQEVVALELRELLSGTFLDGAPMIPVSARSGAGLDELKAALLRLVEDVPSRPAAGLARLPVDRSFVLKGFGTVITGTLVSGRLKEGDEIEVLPGGRRARIRGLHVHHERVSSVRAGQRAAVNLQGLDCDAVPRGSTICRPGELCTTRRAWARLELLDDAPRRLERGGLFRFHQGTSEGPARVRVFRGMEDGMLLVELHLGVDTVLAPGDRFILRRPAPVDTLGGGVVMDVRPPRLRPADGTDLDLGALQPEEAVLTRLARAAAAGREVNGLHSELGLAADELEGVLARLRENNEVVRAGSRWFDGGVWRTVSREVVESVAGFHAEQPLHVGVSREALRGRICREMPQEAWRALLEQLQTEGELRLDGDAVARAGHRVVLSGAELDLARRIDGSFRQAGFAPPGLDQVVEKGESEQAAPIVSLLISQGKLVKIQDGSLVHSEALEKLRELLKAYSRRSTTIDVADFKRLTGVTRKHAIPLLEQLDAERTTRRVGDRREILISE